MSLKKKRDLNLLNDVLKVRKTVKNWFYHVGTKFMHKREFSQSEENFLEEATDFFIDNLDNTENEIDEILEAMKKEDEEKNEENI